MKKLLLHHKTYICAIICILCMSAHTHGANGLVEVPHTLKIGNLKLTITKGARRKIQDRVFKLLRTQERFNEALERFRSYQPVIEEVLREEKLPIDFKYLPLLESQLLANTKNSFGGTGFWQLKDSLARSYGLKINDKVDERLNIIASTRGASRYLRKNNLYFKNWLFTILTLNMGFRETKLFIKERYNEREIIGAQEIYVGQGTHSYIMRFLAYKIAFEEKLVEFNGNPPQLMQYAVSGKTLNQLARKFKVSSALMKVYNPWLKRRRIPRDKTYDVLIPLGGGQNNGNKAIAFKKTTNNINPQEGNKNAQKDTKENRKQSRLEPELHNREKKKPFAVTPPLPQPKIVIQAIEGDKKRYNIETQKKPQKEGEEQGKKETRKTNIPTLVIKDENDNPISYEVVNPQNQTINQPKKQDQKRRNNVVNGNDYNNDNPLPLPPQNNPANNNQNLNPKGLDKQEKIINQNITVNGNRNDYNTSATNRFFPSGLEPRHNDHFINPNTPKAGIHVVAQGQTVFDIARRYNISVGDLRKWNYINNDVYTGQKLVVAPPKSKPIENKAVSGGRKVEKLPVEKVKTRNYNRSRFVTTKTRTYVHVVIRGQSLENIASAYGVKAEDIKEWNKLRSNVIHMGQKIVIFKVIRLLQHASPVMRGQFFRDRKQTPLRDKLRHQQSKSLRKVMSNPMIPED